jgi:hypothetical protein
MLNDEAFLVAGVALYAGEGAKGDGDGVFANSDPSMMRFFSAWLRRFRAVANASIRKNKHEYGCAYLRYTCARTHREIMGLVRALVSSASYSGVAQLAEQGPVKPTAAGSSPAPGASPNSA